MNSITKVKEADSIRSYVFLDLEATSCDAYSRPKITEICMVALHRSAVLNNPRQLPRIADKLLMCVYPNKPITGAACDITGLNNENLTENEKPVLDRHFVASINNFLQRQAAPVGLIAHNGVKFDFPLLKTELQKLNTRLPEGVRFCDSLLAIRDTDTDRDASSKDPPAGRVSYSLENLYRAHFGKGPRRAHTAEDDVLTLIEVVKAREEEVIPWMDQNYLLWEDIQQMYVPSPLKDERVTNIERTSSPPRLSLKYGL